MSGVSWVQFMQGVFAVLANLLGTELVSVH